MDADAPALVPAHEIVKLLQRLISTNVDSALSFRTASERVASTTLRHLCLNESSSRDEFARELRERGAELGGAPEESGTALGGVHRWWMGVRSNLQEGDQSILAELERAERAAVGVYESILREPVGGPLLAVLNAQHDRIQRSCETIGVLRKTAAPA